ncbi:MAG: ATP synthase F1 subunit delta [Clostridia bacterium]|nr:ATP synthase F1 subunit delta [Clostridia bacterium]
MSAIGNEYGNALFLLAQEENSLDAVAEALEGCSKLFDEEPMYVDFLATPGIPIEERIGAIGGAFHGRVPDCVSDFICLLTERGYIRYFSDCQDEFEKQYNLLNNISTAEAYSARELSEAERERLKKRLELSTGRRIKLRTKVDETIVGGMIVKIDGRLYDGSLRSRITEILEEMKK